MLFYGNLSNFLEEGVRKGFHGYRQINSTIENLRKFYTSYHTLKSRQITPNTQKYVKNTLKI